MSDLVLNPEDRISCVAAHMMVLVKGISMKYGISDHEIKAPDIGLDKSMEILAFW